MNKKFYIWIMREWNQKGKPHVWDDIAEKTFSKQTKYIRLWTHKCGQHFVKGGIWKTLCKKSYT